MAIRQGAMVKSLYIEWYGPSGECLCVTIDKGTSEQVSEMLANMGLVLTGSAVYTSVDPDGSFRFINGLNVGYAYAVVKDVEEDECKPEN